MSDPKENTPLIDPEMSVADTATRYPQTVPVFAELNMDTCCGGADSIRKAAEHGGHDLNVVLNKLRARLRA